MLCGRALNSVVPSLARLRFVNMVIF
jgi:hypothetical protein